MTGGVRSRSLQILSGYASDSLSDSDASEAAFERVVAKSELPAFVAEVKEALPRMSAHEVAVALHFSVLGALDAKCSGLLPLATVAWVTLHDEANPLDVTILHTEAPYGSDIPFIIANLPAQSVRALLGLVKSSSAEERRGALALLRLWAFEQDRTQLVGVSEALQASIEALPSADEHARTLARDILRHVELVAG